MMNGLAAVRFSYERFGVIPMTDLEPAEPVRWAKEFRELQGHNLP
jgi:hypothetical protein